MLHNSGFFSNCTVAMHAIVDFFNRHQSVPDHVNFSETFKYFRGAADEAPDVYRDCFQFNPDINIPFSGSIEFPLFSLFDYQTQAYEQLAPFVNRYFLPSQTVLQKAENLQRKYDLDLDNVLTICYRGTDKWKDTGLASFEEFIGKAKEILSIEPDLRVTVQTDQLQFIECCESELGNITRFVELPVTNTDTVMHDLVKAEKLSWSQDFLSAVHLLARSRYLILHTGNVARWMCLYRGHSGGIHQYFKPKNGSVDGCWFSDGRTLHTPYNSIPATPMADSKTDEQIYSDHVSLKQQELQQLYNSFVEVNDPRTLSKAEDILSRIGEINLEIEGLTSRENQRDLSIKFHWGHNHRFNDGLTVTGRMGDRHINLMAQFITRYGLGDEHFKGKDVIDLGCWTGGTTLLLKVLGADHVLVLEEVKKYAQATHDLIVGVYGLSDVLCDGTNLYDLDTTRKFDIAYFPGVVYHLSDPVLALRRLFNALKDGGEIFVESMGIDSEEPICRFEGNRRHHDTEGESAEQLNRGGWNWFVPSQACLARWMLDAGFTDIDCFYSPVTNRVFGYGRRHSFVEITRAGFSVPDIE